MSGKEIDQNQATSDSANLLHIGSRHRSSFTYFPFFCRRALHPVFNFETPDRFAHVASVLKVETQRRIVSRWSTPVIVRNHGNACLFGVPPVISANEGKKVYFRGHECKEGL